MVAGGRFGLLAKRPPGNQPQLLMHPGGVPKTGKHEEWQPVSHGGLRIPAEVGRVTPCAPLVAQSSLGANAVTRPLPTFTKAVRSMFRHAFSSPLGALQRELPQPAPTLSHLGLLFCVCPNPVRGDLFIEIARKYHSPFCFSAAQRVQFEFHAHQTSAAPLKNKKDWAGKARTVLRTGQPSPRILCPQPCNVDNFAGSRPILLA
jgi:hypothetical protein